MPFNPNTDSPSGPIPYALSPRSIPGMELSENVSMKSIHRDNSTPTIASVTTIIPLNDIPISLDFMENAEMGTLTKSISDNRSYKKKKMKLPVLGALNVPDTSEDVVDSDSEQKTPQERPQSNSHSLKRYVSRIKHMGFNREEQYHDTAPSVFDLLVKEGCYSQKTVEVLKILKQQLENHESPRVQKAHSDYTDKQLYDDTVHPKPSKQTSAHI